MSLTEIMSAVRLSAWAEVALLLFLGAFIGVVWRAYSKRSRSELDAAARLPLDEAPAVPGGGEA
jgi:cbb3-type cytochrome oxidase subunit 3